MDRTLISHEFVCFIVELSRFLGFVHITRRNNVNCGLIMKFISVPDYIKWRLCSGGCIVEFLENRVIFVEHSSNCSLWDFDLIICSG